jgi:hypothetical protein
MGKISDRDTTRCLKGAFDGKQDQKGSRMKLRKQSFKMELSLS